jgi:predicted enzyme related to lactoylglutathione lyase
MKGTEMAKAVGVGGVFFKARDPKALSQWYETHLGVGGRVSGDALTFDGPEAAGMTVFAQFPENTSYFGDGPQQFMINFRVDELDALLTALGTAGVRIDPKRQDEGYGRFAWIWDPEGNKVELWEPAAPEA